MKDIDHENDVHETKEDLKIVLDGLETARNAVEMIMESDAKAYRNSLVLRMMHEQLNTLIRGHEAVVVHELMLLEDGVPS